MAKKYYLEVSSIVDNIIGTYADISDYYTTKNGFTIVCDLGDHLERIHVTNKELMELVGGKNPIWKNDKDGHLDRLVFEKE